MNDSVSARDTGLDRLPPQPIVCSANRALDKRPYGGGGERCSPLRRVRTGRAANGRPYGGCGREARGVGDAAPYGGCRRETADG